MITELSQPELRQLFQNIAEYGAAALQDVSEMNRIQLKRYCETEVERFKQMSAFAAIELNKDDNGDRSPEHLLPNLPQYHEAVYVLDCLQGNLTQTKTDAPQTNREIPSTFEELFYNPQDAEPCLKILNEIAPPVIDAINNYIGKGKGVFPLWVRVLQQHKPKPLIKPVQDIIIKDLLNQKIAGLNLSKDASEFRKEYRRLSKNDVESDIKAILSQYSQNGMLGN